MAQNLSRLLPSLTSFDYYNFQEETFLFFSLSRREIPYFLWLWLSSFMCLNSTIWNTHNSLKNKNMTGWGFLKALNTLFPLKSLLALSHAPAGWELRQRWGLIPCCSASINGLLGIHKIYFVILQHSITSPVWICSMPIFPFVSFPNNYWTC